MMYCQVLSIYDLDTNEALHAASRMRANSKRIHTSPEEIREAVSIVGGRLSYLNKVLQASFIFCSCINMYFFHKVAKSKDVLEMARHLMTVEKAWLLSQIGIYSSIQIYIVPG